MNLPFCPMSTPIMLAMSFKLDDIPMLFTSGAKTTDAVYSLGVLKAYTTPRTMKAKTNFASSFFSRNTLLARPITSISLLFAVDMFSFIMLIYRLCVIVFYLVWEK